MYCLEGLIYIDDSREHGKSRRRVLKNASGIGSECHVAEVRFAMLLGSEVLKVLYQICYTRQVRWRNMTLAMDSGF